MSCADCLSSDRATNVFAHAPQFTVLRSNKERALYFSNVFWSRIRDRVEVFQTFKFSWSFCNFRVRYDKFANVSKLKILKPGSEFFSKF